MDLDWLRHPAAADVLALTTDARPAWLWSGDGKALLWHNMAARLFGASMHGDGVPRSELPARPIAGQISRALRMGFPGRAAPSRIQFLAGRTPLAATCMVTPLALDPDQPAVLLVAVNALDDTLLAKAEREGGILPDFGGAAYALTLPDGRRLANAEGMALDAGISPQDFADEHGRDVARFVAGAGAVLTVALPGTGLPPRVREADQSAMENEAGTPAPEAHGPDTRAAAAAAAAAPDDPETSAPLPGDARDDVPDISPPLADGTPTDGADGLAGLFSRLAEDDNLFSPLGEEDDVFDPALVHDHAASAHGDNGPGDVPDAPFVSHDADEAAFEADRTDSGGGPYWRVVGRDLALPVPEDKESEPGDARTDEDTSGSITGDADRIEPATRYNFEELSRILTDRIGREPERMEGAATQAYSAPIVPLSEESLVLNRLPLGILIFRDQEILFVNRALVDLTGHDSASALRALGLAAIIPSIDEETPAGPVSQLQRRDGLRVPVTARLQSISWQGKPAFMLSARPPEARAQDEVAVRAFATQLGGELGADILETDRSGIILSYISNGVIADVPQPGDTLTPLVAHSERAALRLFLELPARHAETERPAIRLAMTGDAALILFVAGRAGLATSYFGLVLRDGDAAHGDVPDTLDGPTLARISRDIRRPLNTILGFSEVMASEAFGPLGNDRYLEYARDIGRAGQAISDLADELDAFVRLAAGARIDGSSGAVDLVALLSNCIGKIRGEAIAARVLLRSSISERLPLVRVDAPSLSQAVLNLLASAVRHGEHGGRVVLAARGEPDGSIAIHVRDTAPMRGDIADRFVIFREGRDRDGAPRQSAPSSIGLTLTRSLIAVNALSLSIDPVNETGTLMTLTIPASRVLRAEASGNATG